MTWPHESPVIYFVFNRPRETAESFSAIRQARPRHLLVVADGPRASLPGESKACEEVRRIATSVDWPCRVETHFARTNLGCRDRITSGLTWAFSRVPHAIILEDDCVAGPDFFHFCQELLADYRDDRRVWAIGGTAHQGGQARGDGSYYFSKYLHVWGWATWADRWAEHRPSMGDWPGIKASDDWSALHPDLRERKYWERVLDRASRGEIDTWDYQWLLTIWRHGGLVATPNSNLVSNIGIGPGATHTSAAQPVPGKPLETLGPITAPSSTVEADSAADRHVFLNDYHGGRPSPRRHPVNYLKWRLVWPFSR